MKEILEKSLLQKIERLEAFEERMMIRLDNFSIKIKEYSQNKAIHLYFEIHPINGLKLTEDMVLVCAIYDKEGAILTVETIPLDKDDFFGFDIKFFYIDDADELIDKLGKIRVYPKK